MPFSYSVCSIFSLTFGETPWQHVRAHNFQLLSWSCSSQKYMYKKWSCQKCLCGMLSVCANFWFYKRTYIGFMSLYLWRPKLKAPLACIMFEYWQYFLCMRTNMIQLYGRSYFLGTLSGFGTWMLGISVPVVSVLLNVERACKMWILGRRNFNITEIWCDDW